MEDQDPNEEDTEPNFMNKIVTFNELNKLDEEPGGSKNHDSAGLSSSESEEQQHSNYLQNFDQLQMKLNNKQLEVQRKCTFGRQKVKTPNFMGQSPAKAEWDPQVRFSDILNSLNKVQKNLVDMKKKSGTEMIEMSQGRPTKNRTNVGH